MLCKLRCLLPARRVQSGIGASLKTTRGIPFCFSMPSQIDPERSSGLSRRRLIHKQCEKDRKTQNGNMTNREEPPSPSDNAARFKFPFQHWTQQVRVHIPMIIFVRTTYVLQISNEIIQRGWLRKPRRTPASCGAGVLDRLYRSE